MPKAAFTPDKVPQYAAVRYNSNMPNMPYDRRANGSLPIVHMAKFAYAVKNWYN